MNEIIKYIKNKTNELFEITVDLIYYIHNKNDLKKSFFSEKKYQMDVLQIYHLFQ